MEVKPEWMERDILVDQLCDSLSYRETRKYLKERAPNAPRFLYKYRTLQTAADVNHVRDIIVNSKLWLSSPQNFNDPFDMSAKLVIEGSPQEIRTRIKNALKEQGRRRKDIDGVLPKIFQNIRKDGVAIANDTQQRAVNEAGVCSFAGDPRSILMWSHYAAHHDGVCLVFEVARDPKTFLRAFKVNYSIEYPIVNWVKNFRQNVLDKILLRKHDGWKYEKESRIVKLGAANAPLKFLPKALCAIIIGCCAKAATLDNLKSLLAERTAASLPGITLYECRRHESRYELRIFKLSKL